MGGVCAVGSPGAWDNKGVNRARDWLLRGGKTLTRVFRFDPKARLEEVAEAARALGERPEVLAVVLFGSLARGEATAFSDADLLVLLRDTPLPFPERLVRYRPEGVRRMEVQTVGK